MEALNIKEDNPETERFPLIVLKPSSNEQGETMYEISRDLYLPTQESAIATIGSLNDFLIKKPTGIKNVDEKLDDGVELNQIYKVTLEEAENMSKVNSCNILGGIFIAYLRSYGIETGKQVSSFNIQSTDMEFMISLYPDLTTYFVSPDKLGEKEIEFAQGVILNNTGSFKVINIEHNIRVFGPEILTKIKLLKRSFRHFAKLHTPSKKVSVRCNMVHSPESEDELDKQTKIFDNRGQI